MGDGDGWRVCSSPRQPEIFGELWLERLLYNFTQSLQTLHLLENVNILTELRSLR